MEFVPIKIAKKLKEKGFKEECVAHYYSNDPTCLIKNTALADYVRQPFCVESIKRSWNRCELNPCSSGCYYDVPTISQVMKWLRDEKDIFIEITVDVNDKFNYYFEIYKKGNDTWEYIGQNDTYDYFEMYEEAAMTGIEWVLDNILL